MVAQQSAKGVFLPYPLLAIIVTLAIVLVSGIVTLEVQVNNLSTTILMRDSDNRARQQEMTDKLSLMDVYLHNDRERIIKLETQTESERKR